MVRSSLYLVPERHFEPQVSDLGGGGGIGRYLRNHADFIGNTHFESLEPPNFEIWRRSRCSVCVKFKPAVYSSSHKVDRCRPLVKQKQRQQPHERKLNDRVWLLPYPRISVYFATETSQRVYIHIIPATHTEATINRAALGYMGSSWNPPLKILCPLF